jgi:hypothetical protein
MMPRSRFVGVDHGQAETRYSPQLVSRLLEVASGPIVTGLEIMPVWVRFTRSTLVGLVGRGQVAVEHAEAALPGHRDRHPRLGDGVHRGAHQRHPQRDLARQPGVVSISSARGRTHPAAAGRRRR